jgi:hypothetical protein
VGNMLLDLHAAGLDGQEIEAAAEQAPERLRGRVGRRLGTENSFLASARERLG